MKQLSVGMLDLVSHSHPLILVTNTLKDRLQNKQAYGLTAIKFETGIILAALQMSCLLNYVAVEISWVDEYPNPFRTSEFQNFPCLYCQIMVCSWLRYE